MQLNFGKYSGKSIELLMLKYPHYINWILRQPGTGRFLESQQYIYKLIDIFNKKSIIGPSCTSCDCDRTASRFTVSSGVIDPYWWCDTCNPHEIESFAGKLFFPLDYISALEHVTSRCNNRTCDHKLLIKILSQAKGLPKRVGEIQAQAFFNV